MKGFLHSTWFVASIYVPIFLSALLILVIPPSYHTNTALTIGKIFWFTSFLFVFTNAIGLLYGNPWHKERQMEKDWLGWHPDKKLVVSYVSRGDNAIALARAIATSKIILEDMGVNYIIEAVTDMSVDVGADVNYLVPVTYITPNNAKYKARALHYASQMRAADQNTFVIHMDEESVLSPEVIRGLNEFITSSISQLRIGQGEIKYNAHEYGKNLLITAVDAIRTGDDLGRFRTQYKLFGKPLFGMHGSFFVVPALLEKKIGFDLGGKGSITEDAYFALVCASKGIKFEWVEGFIREQSPFTLLALLKQRRRWITGLRLLMFDKTINRQQRIMLGINMTLWRAAWIGPVVTIWNVLAGGSELPVWAVLLSAFLSGMVGVVYMVGAYRNVIGIKMHPTRQLTIWVMAGVLMPIACMIEGLAVLYSIAAPVKVFEVVDKN